MRRRNAALVAPSSPSVVLAAAGSVAYSLALMCSPWHTKALLVLALAPVPVVVARSLGDRLPRARKGSARASKALSELTDTNRWVFVLKKNGVRVEKRGADAKDEHSAFAVKATVEIAVPASDVAAILLTRDYDIIRRFNPTIVDGKDLEWRDRRRERTTYILTKPVFPLAPRDFVCSVRHERLPSGAELIINEPTTHHEAPVRRGKVRATLRGLHLVQPLGPNRCLYTCVHEIDPAGRAPRSLVNWFALRRPLQYMMALRELAGEIHRQDTVANRGNRRWISQNPALQQDLSQ